MSFSVGIGRSQRLGHDQDLAIGKVFGWFHFRLLFRHPGLTKAADEPLLAITIERWQVGLVGCGNGAFTERLAHLCEPSEIVGVDASGGQLAYARERLKAHRAVFEEGDAHDLPHEDGSFDAAAMALVISFVSEPAKVVAELARVVRPSGLVATYMWDVPGGGLPHQPVYSALESLDINSPLPPSVQYSTGDAMKTLWRETGLQSVDTTVIPVLVRYPDFEDFWASNTAGVGPTGKTIEGLDPEQREALRARLHDQLGAAEDGSVTYEAFANAVKGRVPS